MTVLLKNNAVSKLAGSIDNTQTTLSVTGGDGGKFPSPSGDQWFPLTLEAISGGSVTREIVRCTARAGDTLTVVRGQEGSSATSFAAGDRVEIRYTAAVFDLVAQINDANGALAVPSGTTAQRDTTGTGAPLRYNTDTGYFEGWDGAEWSPFAHLTGDAQALELPAGTTAQQPGTPSDGLLRFNTSLGHFEGWDGTRWAPMPFLTVPTGSLDTPGGTTGERDGAPAAGYFRFNSTTGLFEGYDGARWMLMPAVTGLTGSLELPAGTTGERDSTPKTGSYRFNTTTGLFEGWDSARWAMTPVVTSPTGSLELPAGTIAERDASPGSAKLLRFNTDTGQYEGYNGTGWVPVGAGAVGGGGDQVFVQNDQAVTQDYTIPAGKNAMSTGPIEISDGVEVTISDGAVWEIL